MEKIKLNLNIVNTDQEIENMFQEYLNCPSAVKAVRKMGIDDEKAKFYIVKIFDFVQDIKYCDKCPGVKNCKKHNPLLCTKLTYERGVVDRELVPCPRILEEVKIQGNFLFKDFDEQYNEAKLCQVDAKQSRAKRAVVQHYMTFLSGKTKKWMYIQGNASAGKSFISAAIANNFAEKQNGQVGFINTSFRFKELSDYSYGETETFESMMESMCSCALLVIDDFGNEYKNDFVRDGILYRILSTRASKNLMTIITSDFSIDDVVELYSTSRPATIRAKQIGNIIKGNCEVFNLDTLPNLY